MNSGGGGLSRSGGMESLHCAESQPQPQPQPQSLSASAKDPPRHSSEASPKPGTMEALPLPLSLPLPPPPPPPPPTPPTSFTRPQPAQNILTAKVAGGTARVINVQSSYHQVQNRPASANSAQSFEAVQPRPQLLMKTSLHPHHSIAAHPQPQAQHAPRLSSHFPAPPPAPAHNLPLVHNAAAAAALRSGPLSLSRPASLSSTYALSPLSTAIGNPGKILLAPATSIAQAVLTQIPKPTLAVPAATTASVGAGLVSPVGGAGSSQQASVTTPGQSPRPSILRKRPSEAPPQPSLSTAQSPAMRKLVYEASTSASTAAAAAAVAASGGPSPAGGASTEPRPDTGDGRSSSVASEEASNHSSGSTISNDPPPPPPPLHPAQPSPRKRQRKQQFESTATAPPPPKAPISKAALKKEPSLTRKTTRSATNGHCSSSPLPLLDSRPSSSQTEKTSETASTLVGEEEEEGEEEEDEDWEAEAGSREGSSSPLSLSPSRRWGSLAGPRWQANPTPPLPLPLSQPPVKAEPKEEEAGTGTGSERVLRPRPSLLAAYHLDWEPRAGHYKRPEYVRPKASPASLTLKRRGDVLEEGGKAAQAALAKMAVAKDTRERLSPWRLGLVEAQLIQMAEEERSSAGEVEELLSGLQPLAPEASEELAEMAATMAQRSRALAEALDETRQAMVQALPQHRAKVSNLIQSYAPKRPGRGKRPAPKLQSL